MKGSFVEVGGLGEAVGVLALELQEFAVGECLSELSYVLHHAYVACLGGTFQGLAQDVVAGEDGNLVGEERAQRRQSAPAVAFVHHIVVHEGSRMQHLQGLCHEDDLVVDLAHHSGRKQHQKRTEPFALPF